MVTCRMDDHLLGQSIQGKRDWTAMLLAFVDEDPERFNLLAGMIGAEGVKHALAHALALWTTLWMQQNGSTDAAVAELRAVAEQQANEEAARLHGLGCYTYRAC